MGNLILEDGDEVLPDTIDPVTIDDFEEYLSKYVGSTHKLALMLDYDGTLAPIAPHPDLATIPREAKKVCLYLLPLSVLY
jgi:trehalose 6-phosphate synthase/phosphatase